ncbi:MAG TPA: SRPBCC family protein [Candidatus Angelobacter sp.]|nr:SRPBCC family protein [Candidatus Angelobacter sp.]
MQRVEGTARLAAPPDEVFAYLSDLDTLAEWQSGVTAAHRTSGGPMRTGATAEVTREMMGQRITAPLLVTAYEPPRRLGIASKVSGVEADALLELADADHGAATDLSFAMEIRGSGMTKFMEPMIAGAARGDIETSLERLRSRFEGSG